MLFIPFPLVIPNLLLDKSDLEIEFFILYDNMF